MKIGWGLFSNSNRFWIKVFCTKHNIDLDSLPPELSTKYGSHLWKVVGEIQSKVLRGVSWAIENGYIARFWAIGNGQIAWFWWDVWLYNGTILAAHTNPQVIQLLPNNVVADFVTVEGY